MSETVKHFVENFQFFPSCCKGGEILYINLDAVSKLSILSQLLQARGRGGRPLCPNCFQFFPSCCLTFISFPVAAQRVPE